MIQKIFSNQRAYLQAFFMLLSVFLFSLNDSLNKIFVSDIRPQEIIFWRSLFETALLLIILYFKDKTISYKEKFLGVLKTPYLKLHFLRVFLGLSAILIEIYSLKFLPLSSLSFIYAFSPILVVFFALLFLKETPSQRVWLMVFCGAISALIISFTGGEVDFFGAEYAIISVILYSSNMVLTKKCSEDGAFRTLFFYALLSIIPCLIACSFHIETNRMQIFFFLGQSFLHMAALFTLVKALSLGDLSRAVPLEYSDILWASLLGFLIFNEIPTSIFWVSAFILVLGKTYYFWKGKKHD